MKAPATPLLSGLIGGLIGTAAMATSHLVWNRVVPVPTPVRRLRDRRAGVGNSHAQPSPRSHTQRLTAGEKLADAVASCLFDRQLDPATRERLGSVSHYAFGATAGLLYAALARRHPGVTAGGGTLYGLAVWLAAEEALMPALGLSPPPTESSLEEHGYVLFGHLAYGLTLEAVRRAIDGRA